MKLIKKLKIKNFMVLFFAGIINSVGVTVFLQPVRLYDSGISGTSMFYLKSHRNGFHFLFFLLCLIFRFLFSEQKSRV